MREREAAKALGGGRGGPEPGANADPFDNGGGGSARLQAPLPFYDDDRDQRIRSEVDHVAQPS